MYSWYENSAVCYTWLGDVSEHNPRPLLYEDEISESRWFTRGWTLQELIAPKEMHFFNKDWKIHLNAPFQAWREKCHGLPTGKQRGLKM
jgi:hypothetical protein